MKTCIERVRDKNGVIIEYVFEDGMRLSSSQLKSLMQQTGSDFITNLELCSDGRIIMTKDKTEQDRILEEIYKLLSKKYAITEDEFFKVIILISKYTGLNFKKLQQTEDGTAVYQLGPYVLTSNYRKISTDKLLTLCGISLSNEAKQYHESHKECAHYWVNIYYGNAKLSTCCYLSLSNVVYSQTSGKGDKSFVNNEGLESIRGLRNMLNSVVMSADRLFNVFDAVRTFTGVILNHYTANQLNSNVVWNWNELHEQLECYINIYDSKADKTWENREGLLMVFKLYNYVKGKTSYNYRIVGEILGKPIKQASLEALFAGKDMEDIVIAKIDSLMLEGVMSYLKTHKKELVSLALLTTKKQKEVLNTDSIV